MSDPPKEAGSAPAIVRALPAGFADRVRDLVDAGRDKEAGALIPDDVLDRFTFSGTPEQVAEAAVLAIVSSPGYTPRPTPGSPGMMATCSRGARISPSTWAILTSAWSTRCWQ